MKLLSKDINSFCDGTGLRKVSITIDTHQVVKEEGKKLVEDQEKIRKIRKDEDSINKKAQQYKSQVPAYNFDLLVLNGEVEKNLLTSVDSIKVELRQSL
ncbi:MAG: hypothetical protein AAGE84_31020 [Cyanobacteria bacterium P01_G01_bin.39]